MFSIQISFKKEHFPAPALLQKVGGSGYFLHPSCGVSNFVVVVVYRHLALFFKFKALPCRFFKMADESRDSIHSNHGSPLPNVNERLAQLRPSKELLEYYRRKIAEFDNEHQEMLAKLDKYKCTYEEQVKNMTWLS